MPIQFLPPNHLTGADFSYAEMYKKWLNDPSYIKVVPLLDKYAVAIKKGFLELRRKELVISNQKLIDEWVIVSTYDMVKNPNLQDWVFIYRSSFAGEDQKFNDTLQQLCISAYRETVNDQHSDRS